MWSGSGALVRCLVPSFFLSPFCGTKAFWDEGTTRGCPLKKVNAIRGIRHRHRGQSNLNIHAPRQVHNRLVTRSPGSPLDNESKHDTKLSPFCRTKAFWDEGTMRGCPLKKVLPFREIVTKRTQTKGVKDGQPKDGSPDPGFNPHSDQKTSSFGRNIRLRNREESSRGRVRQPGRNRGGSRIRSRS